MIDVVEEEWLSDRGVRHSMRFCKKHGRTMYRWYKDARRKAGGSWICMECHRLHNSNDVMVYNTAIVFDEFGCRLTRRRANHLRWTYNLEPIDIVLIYLEQDGKCHYGGEMLAFEDACVDHIHGYSGCKKSKSGIEYDCPKESVRGLSCAKHNKIEGHCADDPQSCLETILKIIEINGGSREDICR